MIILDTDHLSALQFRAAPSAFALQARLEGGNYNRVSLPTLKKVARPSAPRSRSNSPRSALNSDSR